MHNIEKILKEHKVLVDKSIEKWIPRKYDEKSLISAIGRPKYRYDVCAANASIAKPVWELLGRGGKRWRPSLMLLIIGALGKDPKKYVDFVLIPEVAHNGTLMIDDIEDNSDLRRGRPCIHRIYGVDIAINAGNTMYYLPLLPVIKSRLPASKKAKIYEIYNQEMINISFGQGFDIAWHNALCDANNLSNEQYLQMCALKTGTLARMSAKIGAVLADADEKTVEKIGDFAESIGVAFQIQDDILNLVAGSEYGKELGGDISEGKRTLMVIHTLSEATPSDRKKLISILNRHTKDQRKIRKAIGILKKYDSISYAKSVARKIVEESWSDMEELLPETEAKQKLKSFAVYLIERKL